MKNCVETLHEKLEEKIGREFRMKLSTPCNHFFYRKKNNNVLKKSIVNIMEDKYIYLEENTECNICYNQYYNFFKCKRCTFRSCPRCFNNFYFLDDVTYCPMCRY